jgi:hypothetical protein
MGERELEKIGEGDSREKRGKGKRVYVVGMRENKKKESNKVRKGVRENVRKRNKKIGLKANGR